MANDYADVVNQIAQKDDVKPTAIFVVEYDDVSGLFEAKNEAIEALNNYGAVREVRIINLPSQIVFEDP